MMPNANHYQLLGVDRSAPTPTLQSALERLAERATRLAYTSPEGSHELWEQVRRIRADLLSDPARRASYDASLREAPLGAAPALEDARPEPIPAPPSVPHPTARPPSATSSAHPVVAPARIALWPLFAAAAAVALTLVLIFVARGRASARPRVAVRHAVPAPAELSATGFRAGPGFVSGKRIILHWHVPPRAINDHLAVVYRLQVASAADQRFRSPLLSTLTGSTAESLKLPGERRYLWRVKVLIAGRWSPYAPAARFLVARPRTSAPLLRPATIVSRTHGRVRLCWSAVPWAIAYLVRIQPSPGVAIIHGTCWTLTEKPGRYRWTVAGLIRGVQTYPGRFAAPHDFTVPKRR